MRVHVACVCFPFASGNAKTEPLVTEFLPSDHEPSTREEVTTGEVRERPLN